MTRTAARGARLFTEFGADGYAELARIELRATGEHISPSTVEYYLHKVFRKLEVSSRTQLARRMFEPGARAS